MTDDKSQFDEELRSVLGDGSLDPEDREEMAREALREAEERPDRAPRRWTAVLLPAAAVLVAVAAILLFSGKDPERPGAPEMDAIPAAEGSVAEARKLNEAALADPGVQKALAEAPRGSWAVIAHGVLVCTGAELNPLLATARLELPNAMHRFVFRVGEEGDRSIASPLAAPFERVVGSSLLETSGIDLAVARSGAEYRLAEIALRVGAPFAPESEESTYRIEPRSPCPLVLPKDTRFPIFEIPGKVRALRETGEGVSFRRYLVRLRVPGRSIDELVVALGDVHPSPGGPWKFGHLILAGSVWRKFDDEAIAESKRTGKPILLLTGDHKKVSLKILRADVIRQASEMFVLVFAGERPKSLPHLPEGTAPRVTVLHSSGGGPRGLTVRESIEIGSDAERTKYELEIASYQLAAYLYYEGWEGISVRRSPRNTGPTLLPLPIPPKEQLKMLRRIESMVKDPATLDRIREQIAELEKRIAEKQR